MSRQPQGYQPGVYLGITNADYHADPALSSSGVKDILPSLLKYWDGSPLNPDRPIDEETPSKKLGTAYHTLILEPAKFRYTIIPGQKSTSKSGHLGEEEYKTLRAMQKQLLSIPEHEMLFKNGYPEVSIFFRDPTTGIMCRVRFDYWKVGFVTDLKTTEDISNGSIRYEIPRWAYEVSAAMYMTGIEALRQMIKDGTGFIDPAIDSNFLMKFVGDKMSRFTFLMQEKKRPHEARGLVVGQDVAEVGHHKFRFGVEKYATAMEEFGPDRRWPSSYEPIESLTIDQLSNSINYF